MTPEPPGTEKNPFKLKQENRGFEGWDSGEGIVIDYLIHLFI